MIVAALALFIGGEPETPEAMARSAKLALQYRVDAMVDQCKARPNLRAKALSARAVMIAFAKPPQNLSSDRAFKCVMTAAQKLRGVTFGVIGKEQYLDDKGSRK